MNTDVQPGKSWLDGRSVFGPEYLTFGRELFFSSQSVLLISRRGAISVAAWTITAQGGRHGVLPSEHKSGIFVDREVSEIGEINSIWTERPLNSIDEVDEF